MKRARWEKRAQFYMRSARTKATQMIEIDTDVQRMAFNFVQQTYPKIADAFNTYLAPVALDAFNKWAVETGLSKSLLGFQYSQAGDYLTGTIFNGAPYAIYIWNNPKARDPAQSYKGLIFEPGEKAAELMAVSIADTLGD